MAQMPVPFELPLRGEAGRFAGLALNIDKTVFDSCLSEGRAWNAPASDLRDRRPLGLHGRRLSGLGRCRAAVVNVSDGCHNATGWQSRIDKALWPPLEVHAQIHLRRRFDIGRGAHMCRFSALVALRVQSVTLRAAMSLWAAATSWLELTRPRMDCQFGDSVGLGIATARSVDAPGANREDCLGICQAVGVYATARWRTFGDWTKPVCTLNWVHYTAGRPAAGWGAVLFRSWLLIVPTVDVTGAYPVLATALASTMRPCFPSTDGSWQLRVACALLPVVGAAVVSDLPYLLGCVGLCMLLFVFILPPIMILRAESLCLRHFGAQAL
ncbi:unnamed protein product [Prorocentrum cordatum]|uniref:Mannosyltransferase n=1 Tax=Prorocentrum cordatum TaxID=2364126 RepID=A0ABN9VYY4_9DINO|nr:unnamed protein product [Polarella glacialis]